MFIGGYATTVHCNVSMHGLPVKISDTLVSERALAKCAMFEQNLLYIPVHSQERIVNAAKIILYQVSLGGPVGNKILLYLLLLLSIAATCWARSMRGRAKKFDALGICVAKLFQM